MYYVYLIKNEAEEIYYGSTNDLKRRIFERNNNNNNNNNNKSFSTRNHKWQLIYYEAYMCEKDAREREKRLKYHGQALAQLKRRLKNFLNKS